MSFGTLYGVLGVFIAIPITAVIQVLLDRMVINAAPVTELPSDLGTTPWADLGARARALRQQVRVRLRARESRMGIDPGSADHVIDAVDQQIEGAVERVERVIAVAKEEGASMAPAEHAALVQELHAPQSISSRPVSESMRS